MPTDQTALALNLCTQLQAGAEAIMKGIEAIDRLKGQVESAGIDLESPEVEAALAASSLKHAAGADFVAVLGTGAATKAWLEENWHDDILQKVRGGGA